MVSREGWVLYKNPEGVEIDGWCYLHKKGVFRRETSDRRFFRLVRKPTQLWFYSNERTWKPRGCVLLRVGSIGVWQCSWNR
mmetsp:Transcript_7753/g.12651  ORF Transcript_7753/g.12651 Transcript_7753/m.12651 type:complete len:81 (+) Transcript_7753:70-312(+)